MIRIPRGLDLPIAGSPSQQIHDGPRVRTVGVLGPDYAGLKPGIAVQAGERVAKGQTLFTDRHAPQVCYTAPVAGRIAAINRGERRALQSVVIDAEGEDEVLFDAVEAAALDALPRDPAASRRPSSSRPSTCTRSAPTPPWCSAMPTRISGTASGSSVA